MVLRWKPKKGTHMRKGTLAEGDKILFTGLVRALAKNGDFLDAIAVNTGKVATDVRKDTHAVRSGCR
jgi:hypothetical protein